MSGPWTIDQARQAANLASAQQKGAETTLKEAGAALAEAERAYRVALAQTILRLKAEGVAWTVCQDIARGDTKTVADLRFKRDLADAVYEAAKAALWRLNSDRRDVHQFATWSMRVDLRDDSHTHDWRSESVIGGRA